MKLFRVLHWRAKARYWRIRAQRAEKKILELQKQFEAEMWRNRSREDELITVPARAMGLFGMPPRTGPALRTNQVSRISAPADPWDGLTWSERAEFDMNWKPDAEAAGVPLQTAKQKFLVELANRKQPLMDDYAQ